MRNGRDPIRPLMPPMRADRSAMNSALGRPMSPAAVAV